MDNVNDPAQKMESNALDAKEQDLIELSKVPVENPTPKVPVENPTEMTENQTRRDEEMGYEGGRGPSKQLTNVTENNFSMERKSNITKSLVFIIAFLILETNKQMSFFALSRTNKGKYPLPSTLLVILQELCKLLIVILWAKKEGLSIRQWRPSIKFSLPAICYTLSNLIYLTALTYTSPPVWLVLIQTKTLYTCTAYKVIFNRKVTVVQVIGCILIVTAVGVARLASLSNGPDLGLLILFGSQVSAVIACTASLTVELLLKNDKKGFWEQQFWLYTWSCAASLVAMVFQKDVLESVISLLDLYDTKYTTFMHSMYCIVSSALAGLAIPQIVRNLDTIVKDYLAASNNLILSIFTAILFPAEFSLSMLYIIAIMILVCGIFLYEKKKLPSWMIDSPYLPVQIKTYFL